MRMAGKALTSARETLAAVLSDWAARFQGEDASDVLGPLARCANRLHDDSPPPSDEVALLIRTVAAAATLRMPQGRIHWADVSALLPVYELSLYRPAEQNQLLGFMPEPATGHPRFASFLPPRRLWLNPKTLVRPAPLKEQVAAEIASFRREFSGEAPGDEGQAIAVDDQGIAADDNAQRGDAPTDAQSKHAQSDHTQADAAEPNPALTSAPDSDAEESAESDLFIPQQYEQPPPLRIDPSLAATVPLFGYYALVAEQVLDTMAMLNNHRLSRTIEEALDDELRMWRLLDAALQTGPDLVENTEHWWTENLSSPDEWKVWAPCFMLGSIEDARGPVTIDRMLDDLAPDGKEQVNIAGQALHLASGSGAPLLRRELQRGHRDLKRAVGVVAASWAGELDVQGIEHHLSDPSPVVVGMALDAAARTQELPDALKDRLAYFLWCGDSDLVLRATRALLLHGRAEPYRALEFGKLEEALGPHLLQFLVWTGAEKDVPRIERFLQDRQVSGEQLKLVALFGHPAMWSFLAFYLADEDLQDDAVEALTILLGPGVHEDLQLQPGAWEEHLGRVAPQPNTRYRLGRPFGLDSVALEHQQQRVSYVELQQRLDEAAIRSGLRVDTALHGWVSDCEARLKHSLTELQQNLSRVQPGSWDSIARIGP